MRTIIGTTPRNLNARHDVCRRANHNVRLDPLRLGNLTPVLLVKPSFVNRGRKTGGIGRKVLFDSAQGTGTFLDQGFENRRNGGVLKDAEDASCKCGALSI